ncbi:hypothetical protein Droror1_Dr00008915 [Drosera rotundifolia]
METMMIRFREIVSFPSLKVHEDSTRREVKKDWNEMSDSKVCRGGEETETCLTRIGRKTISYMAQRVVGHGSFGVVFQAKCLETGETVAIKKVFQDKRYKNRELQTMRLLDHPNLVSLKHCFFST